MMISQPFLYVFLVANACSLAVWLICQRCPHIKYLMRNVSQEENVYTVYKSYVYENIAIN